MTIDGQPQPNNDILSASIKWYNEQRRAVLLEAAKFEREHAGAHPQTFRDPEVMGEAQAILRASDVLHSYAKEVLGKFVTVVDAEENPSES